MRKPPKRRTKGPVPMHGGGPPSNYDAKYHIPLAKLLASRGATVAEFAEYIGVSRRTVTRWFVGYPEFGEAFRYNAECYDMRVERSLAERAIGFEYDEEELRVIDGVAQRLPVTPYALPDVGAIRTYLYNRMPHKYRSQPEQVIVGDVIEPSHVVWERIQTRLLELAAEGKLILPIKKGSANASRSESDAGNRKR